MYTITSDSIKSLDNDGKLHIECSLTTLSAKKREINEYLKFQNKDWRVVVDSKNHCLRKVLGDGKGSPNLLMLVVNLSQNKKVSYRCTNRHLRSLVKMVNEYLSRNNAGWMVRPNYEDCSIEVM